MKHSSLLGLFAIGLGSGLVACGGRTTLDDLGDLDSGIITSDSGIIGSDGGIVPKDSGIVPPDAGPPPPPPLDAGPPPPQDAGSPGGPISCGNATCNSSSQVCCVTFSGQTVSETCTPQGQCTGAALACTSVAACPPNEVCCGNFSQTKQGSQCAPACQGGFQNPQLCAKNAECPKGTTCKNSPLGVKTCRP